MQAHKLKVTIPEDHRIELRLPDDFPEGPAEVIVLAGRPGGPEGGQQQARAALAELRSVELTPEEKEVLDEFESFRQDHPFRISSLNDED